MADMKIYAYKRYAVVAECKSTTACVVIPQTYKGVPVMEIRECAFSKNEAVRRVVMPCTIQSIGESAFSECSNLECVEYANEEELSVIQEDEEARRTFFSKNRFRVSRLPPSLTEIGARAFFRTGLKGVDLQASTLEIGAAAFADTACLEAVNILQANKLKMGKGAFRNSGLFYFVAPHAVCETASEELFMNCSGLRGVTCRFSAVGPKSFLNCKSLHRLDTPKPIRDIGPRAFEGCFVIEGPYNLGKNPSVKEEKKEKEKREERVMELIEQVFEEEMEERFSERSVLFSLRVSLVENTRRYAVKKVRGCWSKTMDGYRFHVDTPASLRVAELTTAAAPKLHLLLDHLVKNAAFVSVIGERKEDQFLVYDMNLSEEAGKLTPALFREVLRRVRQPLPDHDGPEEQPALYHAKTAAELELLQKLGQPSFPKWVLEAYQRNKDKLSASSDVSGQQHAKRAMDILMNIDWNPHVFHMPSAQEVRTLLDQEFFGLEPVKTRIMEVVAQARRTGRFPKYGILLGGPPGVGKTAVARAVAEIFGVGFIQMDVNSMGRDPETVTSSSRIYNNACPGILLEKMYQIHSSAGVLLLSELDKGSSLLNHDVTDVLLPVLDKTGYFDGFLEEIVPTDRLFCIATANDLSKISKPLLDRFVVIDVAPYTADEKKTIFTKYVLPKMLKMKAVLPDQLQITDAARDFLIAEYATEAGARDLERYAETILGDFCLLQDMADGETPVQKVYTEEEIWRLLGRKRTVTQRFGAVPGEINTACYYDGEAQFFPIQASVEPGNGTFTVLGGPVAKIQEEYCEAAFCCVRNTVDTSLYDFSKLNVTVFIPQRIPNGTENHVGFACYAAICSRLLHKNMASQNTCYIGGCDLFGSLYLDACDLRSLLRAMKARGVTTLYAPMGTSQLVDPSVTSDCSITIMEAPDAKTLFSLATMQNDPAE